VDKLRWIDREALVLTIIATHGDVDHFFQLRGGHAREVGSKSAAKALAIK